MEYERYAVYFCPRPDTALARFGESWFEENSATADIPSSLIAQARRYGFHATLKPPFRLNHDVNFKDLEEATETLASSLPFVCLEGLVLKELGRFLALVPARASPDLDDFAFRCVCELDHLRAPLDASEISRRLDAGLTARQESLLFTWGYPYVGKEFRFHMTLTGQLTQPEMRRAKGKLEELVQDFARTQVPLDDICICGDPGNRQPFRLIKRVPLKP